MKSTCKKIQDTLAADGPQALRQDKAAQQHLTECNECFAFLESLSEIENGIQNMPRLDAPDSVVESLLARPELAEAGGVSTTVEPAGWRGAPGRFASALAGLLRPRTMAWGSVAAGLLMVVFAIGVRNQMLISPVRNSRESVSQLVDEDRDELMARGNVDVVNGEGRRLEDGREDDSSPKPDAEPSSVTAPSVQLQKAGEDSKELRQFAFKKPAPTSPSPQPPMERKVEGKTKSKNEVFRLVEEQAEAPAEQEFEEVDRFGDEAVSNLPDSGLYYDNVVTVAPGDQDPDGTGKIVGGSRSRELNALIAPDDQHPAKDSLDSVEEMRLGAGAEVGGVHSGFADMSEGDKRLARKEKAQSQSRRSGRISGPMIAGRGGVSQPVLIEDSRVEPLFPEIARTARVETRVVLQLFVRTDGTVGQATVLESGHPNLGFEQAAVDAVKQWRYEPALHDGKPVDSLFTVVVDFKLDGATDNSGFLPGSAGYAAQAFLDERASLEGLTFKPATGYWSTGYVPGDPALRLLQSRLEGWDRSALQAYLPSSPQLHDASRQVGQPFDAPEGSALAVYLHADRRGITDEGRVLLQVGLQGTQRHGGRRSVMNLGIVLDLREKLTSDVAIGLRSLIDAFNKAKEPGDRFRLFVAGRSEDLVVDSKNFRHGYLKVTLDRLLAEATSSGKTVQIVDSVRSAIECIAGADDPDAPLGSSAVIVITPGAFGSATRMLAGLAHESAVAGIPVSVIGVGPDVELSEIDFVTLAGQGSRRLLEHASEAPKLVDRELSAASRAIARAVRLRIRLAPGVRLINVLGSERLDEIRAQQVRDAEKSIDLRLSRNLGIQADRGEDEEGIQVVIPSFYAGDSHVMLLEVVVPGPGPVADVTVRYKDLAHLRNAVGRASLGLGRDMRPIGPLERNVLKNLLSYRLSETLDEAGRTLATGDVARATALLENFQTLLEGLRLQVPGLDHDAETIQDIAMLDEYRTLLATDLSAQPQLRNHLSDSLRYAARLKLQSHPMET